MIRVAIHGGVGSTSDESQKDVDRAGSFAKSIDEKSGSTLDIAIAAVVSMEDDDLFNAGAGSSMRWDGSCQLDESVMSFMICEEAGRVHASSAAEHHDPPPSEPCLPGPY